MPTRSPWVGPSLGGVSSRYLKEHLQGPTSGLSGLSRRSVESLGATVATLAPRSATLVEPPELSRELVWALRAMGATPLYSHQLEAYERVRAGENVIVATATAS